VTDPSQPVYVCGYSEGEFERLETQGAFFAEISRRFLETAGVRQGMHVLDIGCGIGDLSFLAADIVGVRGSVLGIDHAQEPLTRAKSRAADGNVGNVEFRQTGIEELVLDRQVDALIGRFVLMHQRDPGHTLRVAVRNVRRGGLVAFLESHMSALVGAVHSCPHSETYDRIVRLLVDVIQSAGAHTDMGLRLRQVFVEAGVPSPRLWLQARVEGGTDAAIYRYIVDSLRSMLPLADSFGIAKLSLEEVDELERQLKEEVTASGGVLTSPILVGAWCELA
jgi:ubiquinone/menaquinone biosynthesis C-methylase UbiE